MIIVNILVIIHLFISQKLPHLIKTWSYSTFLIVLKEF